MRAIHVSLPRMRGDRPTFQGLRNTPYGFTPHARGSTTDLLQLDDDRYVYPACAGIDPCRQLGISLLDCLPRMRGDRPSGLEPTRR